MNYNIKSSRRRNHDGVTKVIDGAKGHHTCSHWIPGSSGYSNELVIMNPPVVKSEKSKPVILTGDE